MGVKLFPCPKCISNDGCPLCNYTGMVDKSRMKFYLGVEKILKGDNKLVELGFTILKIKDHRGALSSQDILSIDYREFRDAALQLLTEEAAFIDYIIEFLKYLEIVEKRGNKSEEIKARGAMLEIKKQEGKGDNEQRKNSN